MKKILVASHGYLAKGLKSSIGILAGDAYDINVISAYTEDFPGDYTVDINNFIDSVTPEDEAVIFTDILGGSVNQKVCQLMSKCTKNNIYVITGVNLMILLTVLLESRPLNEKVLNELINESQVSIVKLENDTEEVSEEDFLN